MPTLDVEDIVLTDLRALESIEPAPVHYVDEAPADDKLPTQNGQVKPFVVLHPGAPFTSGTGKGIINTTLDPVSNYLIIEVVAPNYGIAAAIGNDINDRVMGRQYAGASEMVLQRAVKFSEKMEARVPPVTYRYALQYGYLTNLGG